MIGNCNQESLLNANHFEICKNLQFYQSCTILVPVRPITRSNRALHIPNINLKSLFFKFSSKINNLNQLCTAEFLAGKCPSQQSGGTQSCRLAWVTSQLNNSANKHSNQLATISIRALQSAELGRVGLINQLYDSANLQLGQLT